MDFLITGGAGFIAFHLGRKLLEEGHSLTLVDNFNRFYDPSLKRKNVRDLQAVGPAQLIEADIRDRNGLRRAFSAARPGAVVHLAAMAGVLPSLAHPGLYADVNVSGTIQVLDLAEEFKTERFIFASSSSVYGGNTKVPFSETDPVDHPISPYAATKKAGELLCHTYSHNFGMHIACLRFFTVYGPRQRPEMAIHKFAQLICRGEEIPVYGDGTTRRDYTYVDDIVDGIRAAVNLNPRFEILNLGESQTTSLLELIGLLEDALGKKARIRSLPAQAGDMPITYADIGRAKQVLGYNPQIPLKEGIMKFARWYLENPR